MSKYRKYLSIPLQLLFRSAFFLLLHHLHIPKQPFHIRYDLPECQNHLKSTSSVHSHLESLERKGYIRRDPTKPRAIEILDDSFQLLRKEMVNVPIVGKIAAGSPLLAVENIESYFPIPSEYLPNAQTFLLEVKGESMINAGVLSGDHILVKQQDTAENGEMVAALIDDSATVKTFYHENGHIRLQPENDTMDPIVVEEKDVHILGKVIGVFRFFS